MTATTPSKRATRRALIASGAGTLIEWYDYSLYGAASGLIIGPLFFPDVIPVAGAMLAFATFAVGFIVRPLGGLVISHLGDRVGRKPAMLLTIILMGIATVGIGLLPTAATIGVWAAILLVFFRFVQGFGAGAELAGAITMVSEYAKPSQRGLFVGIVSSGAPGGALLATIAFTIVSSLPGDALLDWAWRVPFLISAVLFLLALWIRHRLEETPEYEAAMARQAQQQKLKVPLGELLRRSPRQLLAGFMSVTGHNANNYLISAFALSYLTLTVGVPQQEALVVIVVASAFGVLGPIVLGLVTDRIGVRRVLIFGGVFGVLMAYPTFWALQSANPVLATIALSLLGFLGVGATAASTGTFLANIFPTRYRYTGMAAARELNGAAVAGPTPLIATALIAAANGEIWLVAIFIGTCSLITLLAPFVAGHSHGDIAVVEAAE